MKVRPFYPCFHFNCDKNIYTCIYIIISYFIKKCIFLKYLQRLSMYACISVYMYIFYMLKLERKITP